MNNILKTYKDRLVNLNGKNRCLVLNKIAKKRAFDLFVLSKYNPEICQKLLNYALSRYTKSFKIIDLSCDGLTDKKVISEYNAIDKHLTDLKREIELVEKEKGCYDLYLGYPFVEGKFGDGTFVRAPLILFSIKLFKKDYVWYAVNNLEEDISLNTTFLMAYQKYNQHKLSEFETEFDELPTNETPEEWIFGLLNKNGIKIHASKTADFTVFMSYKAKERPEYNSKELHIKHNILLGQFPLSNSSLNEDYEVLINSETKSKNLYRLLANSEEVEINDANTTVSSSPKIESENIIEEKDNFFVTPTDLSQENAVFSARNKSNLVIYGPPGTGKSQVIVNLIADNLAHGKKVLMVSQKRAALDVVYNRLAKYGLEKFTGFVHDYSKDRRMVFDKTLDILEDHAVGGDYKVQLKSRDLAQIIDNKISTLSQLGIKLHKTTRFGLSFYDLFSISDNNNDFYIENLDISMFADLTYPDLVSIADNIGAVSSSLKFDLPDYILKERVDFSKIQEISKDTIIQSIINSIKLLSCVDSAELKTVLHKNIEEFSFLGIKTTEKMSNSLNSTYVKELNLDRTVADLDNMIEKCDYVFINNKDKIKSIIEEIKLQKENFYNGFISELNDLDQNSKNQLLLNNKKMKNIINEIILLAEDIKIKILTNKPPIIIDEYLINEVNFENIDYFIAEKHKLKNNFFLTRWVKRRNLCKRLELSSNSYLDESLEVASLLKTILHTINNHNRHNLTKYCKNSIGLKEMLVDIETNVNTLINGCHFIYSSITENLPTCHSIDDLENYVKDYLDKSKLLSEKNHLILEIISDSKKHMLINQKIEIATRFINDKKNNDSITNLLDVFNDNSILNFLDKLRSSIEKYNVTITFDLKNCVSQRLLGDNTNFVDFNDCLRDYLVKSDSLSKKVDLISEIILETKEYVTAKEKIKSTLKTIEEFKNSSQTVSINDFLTESQTKFETIVSFIEDNDIIRFFNIEQISNQLAHAKIVKQNYINFICTINDFLRISQNLLNSLNDLTKMNKNIVMLSYGLKKFYVEQKDELYNQYLIIQQFTLEHKIADFVSKNEFDYGFNVLDSFISYCEKIDQYCNQVNSLSIILNKNKIHKVKQYIFNDTKGSKELSELRNEFGVNFSQIKNFDIYKNNFSSSAKNYEIALIEAILPYFNNHLKKIDNIADIIKNTFYLKWIKVLESESSSLVLMIQQESRIRNELKDLITEKRKLNSACIIHKIAKNIEETEEYNRLGNGIRYRNLKHEAGKKKKCLSLRKFFHSFTDELLTLLPCWLVTPEAASAILPLQENLFDIVIYDEASQMFVENGIPTLYRASSCVIAGDDKQLKPNDLYQSKTTEDDEEIDEDEYVDNSSKEVESLLDLAKNRFESVWLSYHYRSEFEELINFSNYAMYSGKLQTIPNLHKTDIRPIERIKVNGIWESRNNVLEAKAVVNLVHQILKNRKSNETIGIITFNATQQECISDLFDKIAETDLELRSLLEQEFNRIEGQEDKSLFVKNIENVQGDERDIIIFSIAYAKDIKGKVSANFGSLSKDGGENRLNVAISRAKKKIFVVTSIEPEELNTDSTKNKGPKLLKKYLEYARAVSENRINDANLILHSMSAPAKSNEEQNTKDMTRLKYHLNEGLAARYQIHENIGSSDYKIDWAVYDSKTDRYLLGIEGDGHRYKTARSIKERDVYRHDFLASRGWEIYRLFSRNWWADKDLEIEKIKQLIEN